MMVVSNSAQRTERRRWYRTSHRKQSQDNGRTSRFDSTLLDVDLNLSQLGTVYRPRHALVQAITICAPPSSLANEETL